jgi:hypothetical protein
VSIVVVAACQMSAVRSREQWRCSVVPTEGSRDTADRVVRDY